MIERLKLTLDKNKDTIDSTYYQSIFGEFIQLGHSSHDILYSIGIVSHFMIKPHNHI